MIIVKLFGGLGNQMFQYAAGRRLALVHNVPLKLDTDWFNFMPLGDAARSYALGVFSFQEHIASEEEIRFFEGARKSKFRNMLNCFNKKSKFARDTQNIVKEKFFHFDQSILNLPDNSYLIGYWQSEKYFGDVAEIIRQEFIHCQPLAGKNLELADQIRNTTSSVSIHVRRGDYASNPVVAEFHGLCGLDYYRRCIDELARRVTNPHFFIFSDDPGWSREHLKFDFPLTHVDHNDISNGHEDLRLMSLCCHNITANSSFSWWGAWLNPNPSKLVYAPSRWFNNTDIDTKDLIPSTWMQI
jgi:hypothetical protein